MERFVVYERSLCQSYRSAVLRGAHYCSFAAEGDARDECVSTMECFELNTFYVDTSEGRLCDPVAERSYRLHEVGLGEDDLK